MWLVLLCALLLVLNLWLSSTLYPFSVLLFSNPWINMIFITFGIALMSWQPVAGILVLLALMTLVINVSLWHTNKAATELGLTLTHSTTQEDNDRDSGSDSLSEASDVTHTKDELKTTYEHIPLTGVPTTQDWRALKILSNVSTDNGWSSFDVRNNVFGTL